MLIRIHTLGFSCSIYTLSPISRVLERHQICQAVSLDLGSSHRQEAESLLSVCLAFLVR